MNNTTTQATKAREARAKFFIFVAVLAIVIFGFIGQAWPLALICAFFLGVVPAGMALGGKVGTLR